MSTIDTAFRLDSLDGLAGLDDFDVARSLTSDAAIAAYINDVISSGEQALINEALKNVIKVKGVAAIAGIAGLTREGTYKALRPASKPRFETVAWPAWNWACRRRNAHAITWRPSRNSLRPPACWIWCARD